MTSALFVDDHPIVLRGCRIVLEDLGVSEIYEETSIDAGFHAYLRHRPDVTILDLTFDGDDLGGLSLIGRLVREDKRARILVFSMHSDPAIVMRALETGAMGYVLKDTSSTELALAFEHLLRAENYLSHQLAVQVAMLRLSGNAVSETQVLTDREKRILEFLSRGHDYARIAQALGVSYKTITNACSAMRSKLKIGSLAELIRFSIRNDLRRLS